METDPTYKQIIPYLIFVHNNRYFLMQRANAVCAFADSVPPEWPGGKDAADQILEYLLPMKGHILPALEAIKTILK